jgi:hypothetical protein
VQKKHQRSDDLHPNCVTQHFTYSVTASVENCSVHKRCFLHVYCSKGGVPMRRLGYGLLLAAFIAGLCTAQAQEKPRLRSMHLAGQTDTVIQEAFQLYGMSVTFVKPIRGLEQPLELDLTDADLATTSAVLDLLTRCFFVPVNAHVVLAVQDDREHRSDYERLFTEAIPDSQSATRRRRTEE